MELMNMVLTINLSEHVASCLANVNVLRRITLNFSIDVHGIFLRSLNVDRIPVHDLLFDQFIHFIPKSSSRLNLIERC